MKKGNKSRTKNKTPVVREMGIDRLPLRAPRGSLIFRFSSWKGLILILEMWYLKRHLRSTCTPYTNYPISRNFIGSNFIRDICVKTISCIFNSHHWLVINYFQNIKNESIDANSCVRNSSLLKNKKVSISRYLVNIVRVAT